MARRETKTLSFTKEQAKFVDSCVRSGRYQSASEVVRAGVRLLEEQEQRRKLELAQIKKLVQEGSLQIDNRDWVKAEAVFKRLDKLHTKLEGES